MNLEDIYKQIEELENYLEYYENLLETLMPLPQATNLDKTIVSGGKKIDKMIRYVESEDSLKIKDTIKYIKQKLKILNDLKQKELDRLAKYGDAKVVVLLKECEFIREYGGKKRHLTWEEIAKKAYCSRKTAINWYNEATKERVH